ncbi:hypothetical protein ACIPRL_07940 [Streptomyces sp. NPDC090085]|uniref:hypothetical protein n=1 Tax=Streptomyces sp. NPDC090085 TaxID=3365943 RepID=UPI0038135E74
MKLSDAQTTTLDTIANQGGHVDAGTRQRGIYPQSLAPLERAGLLAPAALRTTLGRTGNRVRYMRLVITPEGWAHLGRTAPGTRTVSVLWEHDGDTYEQPVKDETEAAAFTAQLTANGYTLRLASSAAEGPRTRTVSGAELADVRTAVEVDSMPAPAPDHRSKLTRPARRAAWQQAARQPAPAAGVTLDKSPCSPGAKAVEISAYPLVGAALRLVCHCGTSHAATSAGAYRAAVQVPDDTVTEWLRTEGYELAGDWARSVIGQGGEWEHAGRRAPVRLLPLPAPVPVPVPTAEDGERLQTLRADGWWKLGTREGYAYEIAFRPARRRGQAPVSEPLHVSFAGRTGSAPEGFKGIGRAATWETAAKIARQDSERRAERKARTAAYAAGETRPRTVTARVDRATELVSVVFPAQWITTYREERDEDGTSNDAAYRIVYGLMRAPGNTVHGKRGARSHTVARWMLPLLADVAAAMITQTESAELAPATRRARLKGIDDVLAQVGELGGVGVWPMGHGSRPWGSEAAHCDRCAPLVGERAPAEVVVMQAAVDAAQAERWARVEAEREAAAEKERAEMAAGESVRETRDRDGDTRFTREDAPGREWLLVRVRPLVYELTERGRLLGTFNHPIPARAHVARLDLAAPLPLAEGDAVTVGYPVASDTVGVIQYGGEDPRGSDGVWFVLWPGASAPVAHSARTLVRPHAYAAGQRVKLAGSRGVRGTVQHADGDGWAVQWDGTPEPRTHRPEALQPLI